jgi:hypothetical protein
MTTANLNPVTAPIVDDSEKSQEELAIEVINSLPKTIGSIINKLQELTVLYSGNQIDKANIIFAESIEYIDLFIQLITKIHSIFSVQLRQMNQLKKIQKLEYHLLSVLKALLPAKEKQDIIMLCDLIEYELIDNLTQWKIDIIPGLKKLENTKKV